MSFYDEHLPVSTRLTKNIRFAKMGIPLVSIVIIAIIMYSSEIKPHLSEPFFDSNNVMVVIFIMIIIADVILMSRMEKIVIKREYLKKYGTKADGVITKISSFPTNKIELQFNGAKHVKKISPEEAKKFKVNKNLRVAYNPENIDDFVILDGIDSYMRTFAQKR